MTMAENNLFGTSQFISLYRELFCLLHGLCMTSLEELKKIGEAL